MNFRRNVNAVTAIALVANGEPTDPTTSSGTPSHLLEALRSAAKHHPVFSLSSRPSRLLRWAARLATFSPRRPTWDGKYLYGFPLAAIRSTTVWSRLRRASPGHDRYIIYAVGWYYLPTRDPYIIYTDATSTMLQGARDVWTVSEKLQRRREELEKAYYSKARHIFTMSREAAKSLRDDYGIPASRIDHVGGGVSLRPDAEISWNSREPSIVFVGREAQRKGLPDLLLAFKGVREWLPGAQLVIVGLDLDTADDGVISLGEVSDRSHLSRILLSARVFCLPARQESFGLVVPEAMAHGLPCVVTNVGELGKMVDHGEDGFIVEPGDIAALQESLFKLVGNPHLAAQMGRAALRKSDEYSWPAIAKKMLDWIDSDLERQDEDLGSI